MKKIFPLLFLAICFHLNTLYAQQNNFVAKTGNEIITPEEFKLRYELMPLVSVNKNEDSLKHELLYTLISEKLLAMEAMTLGYDRSPRFLDIYTPLEKMFVRDALYKTEVESKVKISPEEIKKGVEKAKYELTFNIINSFDSSEIFMVYSQLLKGASFDSILHIRPEYKEQERPFTASFGNIEDENIEDTLFSLLPGKFSSPVKSKNAWFIFYLQRKLGVYDNPDISKLESDVTKTIKGIKSRTIGLAYMKPLLSDLNVNADSAAFWKIVYKITGVMQKKDTVSKVSKDLLYLTEQDIAVIKNELGPDTLKMIFVPFKNNPVTINDFLNSYYHNEFKINHADTAGIAYKLSRDFHSFVEGEVLAREGYRRGFDKLPEVQHDLNMWKESFLAQLYRNSFISDVKTDSNDVLKYYNELYNSNQPVKQVKIIELATPDLSVIEAALNEIKAGKDFKVVAASLTNVKKDEPEFFPVTERGEIGKIAGGLNIGDVYGPMKTQNGYLLIKLIDKKEDKQTPPQSYDDIKEKLKMDLLNKKLDKIITDKTVELTGKYPVTINEKILSGLKLTSINMFTYRYMGFGGRISAVPYSYPFHEWSNETLNIKKILP